MGEIERLTVMESKILELGKKQHDRGYQGGSFTPGFIRKETEYGYRAINVALVSLIAQDLVEKTVTNTFRDGSLVELDVYKVTDKGMAALARVASGSVSVDGKEPQIQKRSQPEPRPYVKPWDVPKPKEYDKPAMGNSEVEQSVRSLEASMRTMAAEIKAINSKLDVLLSQRPSQPPAEARNVRAMAPEALSHRAMVLAAARGIREARKIALAEDVKQRYFADCEVRGTPPKGATQFTAFLKRMEAEGLVSLERVGCRNLGIKGQGSRVVVTLTPEGERLLADRN